MEFLNSVFWLLILLGVMIIIHELGHYWAALLCGVKVEQFSLGFGPRLFGFKVGETDFRFSAILFGGYVKMLGQEDLVVDPGTNPDPRSFMNKPRYQRLFIIAAGPLMNILLAVGLLMGLFMYQFPKPTAADGPAVVGHVEKGSPAALAGVQEGDTITKFEGVAGPSWEDIVMKELTGAGKEFPLTVKRGGQTLDLKLAPKTDEKTQVGYAGWREQTEIRIKQILKGFDAERVGLMPGDVVISVNQIPVRSVTKLVEVVRESGGKSVELIYERENARNKVSVQPKYSENDKRWMIGIQLEPKYVVVALAPGEALEQSLKYNLRSATMIFDYLKGVIEMRLSPKQFEGPVGIARMAAAAAKEGLADFVSLMAMVSLNLAVFNLLPIPVLDGGGILVLLVEMIRRRDLSLQLKERVLQLGLAFLLMMVVFVLFNDISKAVMPKG
ncbi:MAG: RIP metalloprotease RseP [Bryobacter sp.]|jgi:regulator of sigma E protease|nr:RIP metalloprotease RseP [Bryobacter sp. CoA8 C33]